MKESTYVMLKPDGVRKKIFEQVVARFEKAELKVSNIKIMYLFPEIVKEHYIHLIDKPFYPILEEYLLSGPVIAMIVEGDDAIKRVRDLIGATNSKDALPGTIRGDYGDKTNCTYNVIHGSDSAESAANEIARFYPELMDMSKEPDETQKKLFLKPGCIKRND